VSSISAFPHFKMLSKSSSNDPESAVLHDPSELLSSVKLSNTPHGLFNDKYPLHTIPHPTKQNVLMNRISYNIRTDSYYENYEYGIINKKYIEVWDQGALYLKNLVYHHINYNKYLEDEYGSRCVYLKMLL